MAELLIGCGNRRDKLMGPVGEELVFKDLTTLDHDPDCKPDVEWDLARIPLPFPDDSYDEIHAYHVLEHIGAQGDYKWFFAQFSDFWRILKPGGRFCCAVPSRNSVWLLGDPGHTRAIVPEQLTFLNQPQYTEQVGVTAFADYRRFYKADFDLLFQQVSDDEKYQGQFFFILQAIKPSRVSA